MSKQRLPVVQTAGLTKVFKDFWRRPKVAAVKDLNLNIQPGEVFGLLGPNGSGKSTTIKLMLGLLYPTKGRISVFGRPPTDVAVKKRIGYLPEESYLYRFLDARETLAFYSRLFRQAGSQRRDRVELLLDMVGLKQEAKRRIGEYSKGMARRIGLAQALINDPEFLILDEPTSGLDPIGTRQIKDVIRRLGDMGKTILLSSHLLADVEDVCDRVCVLYGGQERAAGAIGDLLRQEDQTQITTQHLTDDTVEAVREVIRQRQPGNVVDVSAPRERLENLFIRIVEDAQTARVATSGVGQAGAIPEFLGTSKPEGDDVIDALLSAAQRETTSAEPVEPIEAMPKESPATSKLVEELMAGSKSADEEDAAADTPSQPTTEAPASRPAPSKPIRADESVIEGLLGKKDASDG